ncbi:MAG: hypothetical protein HY900_02040 [Deltaproteobacteria bacterium]|nr:hypothetical protein [Deltaproteobacteria bacterium]
MKGLFATASIPRLAAAAALLPANASAVSAVGPLLRGHLAQLAGDPAASLSAYREAVRTDPDSAELRSIAARALASKRQLAPALELVEEGIQRAPDRWSLILLKAKLLDALGKKEEGIQTARLAVAKGGGTEAYPSVVGMLGSLGRV